jgi:glycosyltransferase involved in cell wall biosynthesis
VRAALLPTPGDPFMLAYWLRNFETWSEHVDELVVLVNGPIDDSRPEVLEAVARAGGRSLSVPYRLGHDGALRWLLENTKADHVVLCEDDAYVRHPKAVDEAFRKVITGHTDIVGSPRHEDDASSPLQVWPDRLTTDHEEVRRGLWPAFLFARRTDLLATDRIFGDRRWNLGETIEGLGIPVTRELCEFVGIAPDYIHLDTLFGTTFQLRSEGLRVELVHHVRLFDAAAAEQWIAEDPPWFHVTGLSTLDQFLGADTLPDSGLWERRVAWWVRTLAHKDMEMASVRTRDIIAAIIRHRLDSAAIAEWTDRFEPWVTWLDLPVAA